MGPSEAWEAEAVGCPSTLSLVPPAGLIHGPLLASYWDAPIISWPYKWFLDLLSDLQRWMTIGGVPPGGPQTSLGTFLIIWGHWGHSDQVGSSQPCCPRAALLPLLSL